MAAVGVAAQLKIDAARSGLEYLFWLVREEDQGSVRRATVDRASGIGAVATAKPVRARIVDAREVEARGPLSDGHSFVAKDPNAEAREFRDPVVDARVVLVIACDEVDAMSGPKRPNRSHFRAEIAKRIRRRDLR